jgi:hypothetical protein
VTEKPKYTPDKIPEQMDIVIYSHYSIQGYNYGTITNYDFDASGEKYVCIAKTPVHVTIPPVGDLKNKVVEALEAEKKKQQAEHHKKMFELKNRQLVMFDISA